MNKLNLIAILSVIFTSSLFADHSIHDLLEAPENKGKNLFHAVHNLKLTKGPNTVCDFENSIQVPVPQAASTINTWRQIVLCFENQEQYKKAQEWLAEHSLSEYGKNRSYGLPLFATMDVWYVTDEETREIVDILSLTFK